MNRNSIIQNAEEARNLGHTVTVYTKPSYLRVHSKSTVWEWTGREANPIIAGAIEASREHDLDLETVILGMSMEW